MAKLFCMTLVLVVGVGAITAMQMHALSRGVDGTLFSLTLVVIGGLVAGFCGFNLKEVLSWWKGR